MADGMAPPIDKVVSPAPGAPEASSQALAGSGLGVTAPTFKPTSNPAGPAIPGLSAPAPPPSAPAEAPLDKSKPILEEKKLEQSADGVGPAHSPPKPVEVMSVPETPVNGSTPAGGTPRPELNIPAEKVEIPESSGGPVGGQTAPSVTTGVQEPTATPAVSMPQEDSIPDPIKDGPSSLVTNGKPAGEPVEMTGAIQSHEEVGSAGASTLKRKLEEDKPSAPVNGGAVSQPEPERAEKKAKVDDHAEPAPASVQAKNNAINSMPTEGNKPTDSNATVATEENKATEKPNGRAKRGMGKRAKKIAEAVVGKTARKTRSQGPA